MGDQPIEEREASIQNNSNVIGTTMAFCLPFTEISTQGLASGTFTTFDEGIHSTGNNENLES